MEKINIAELLKNCPKGMELDCTMFDDVKFIEIEDDDKPICIRTGDIYRYLTKFGTWTFDENAKCVIFPKGKTTWKGFQRPFKDGDIVATKNGLFIGIVKIENGLQQSAYVAINEMNNLSRNISYCFERLATEEEKQKLFDAIKANGNKWNEETKTLEKLVEPKFKVGDKVLWNYDTKIIRTISKVQSTKSRGYIYWIDSKGCSSGWWNENELTPIPNKFDITTLKPFESKVLVRDINTDEWKGHFFSHYDNNSDRPYICIGVEWINEYKQCIPYEGNEHLLGTTNDCDEFYKTWKL